MTFFRLDGIAVVGAGGGDGWVSSDNIIVSFLAYDRVDGMVKGLVKVKRFYVLRSATCYPGFVVRRVRAYPNFPQKNCPSVRLSVRLSVRPKSHVCFFSVLSTQRMDHR